MAELRLLHGPEGTLGRRFAAHLQIEAARAPASPPESGSLALPCPALGSASQPLAMILLDPAPRITAWSNETSLQVFVGNQLVRRGESRTLHDGVRVDFGSAFAFTFHGSAVVTGLVDWCARCVPGPLPRSEQVATLLGSGRLLTTPRFAVDEAMSILAAFMEAARRHLPSVPVSLPLLLDLAALLTTHPVEYRRDGELRETVLRWLCWEEGLESSVAYSLARAPARRRAAAAGRLLRDVVEWLATVWAMHDASFSAIGAEEVLAKCRAGVADRPHGEVLWVQRTDEDEYAGELVRVFRTVPEHRAAVPRLASDELALFARLESEVEDASRRLDVQLLAMCNAHEPLPSDCRFAQRRDRASQEATARLESRPGDYVSIQSVRTTRDVNKFTDLLPQEYVHARDEQGRRLLLARAQHDGLLAWERQRIEDHRTRRELFLCLGMTLGERVVPLGETDEDFLALALFLEVLRDLPTHLQGEPSLEVEVVVLVEAAWEGARPWLRRRLRLDDLRTIPRDTATPYELCLAIEAVLPGFFVRRRSSATAAEPQLDPEWLLDDVFGHEFDAVVVVAVGDQLPRRLSRGVGHAAEGRFTMFSAQCRGPDVFDVGRGRGSNTRLVGAESMSGAELRHAILEELWGPCQAHSTRSGSPR